VDAKKVGLGPLRCIGDFPVRPNKPRVETVESGQVSQRNQAEVRIGTPEGGSNNTYVFGGSSKRVVCAHGRRKSRYKADFFPDTIPSIYVIYCRDLLAEDVAEACFPVGVSDGIWSKCAADATDKSSSMTLGGGDPMNQWIIFGTSAR
jgi:hypothetical protein